MENKEGVSPHVQSIQIGPLLHSSIPILPLSLLRQQALLCPGPGQATSHIFYEPDTYDDLDQEDPDDDLDV